MKIVEYINSQKMIVEFQDDYKYRANARYQSFIRGCVHNPYDKTTYRVGYIGVGDFSPSKNKKNTREYSTWVNIMQRCYSETQKPRHEAYWDCMMCDEWFNFQNFAKWYSEHYYEVAGCRMHIDKDVLCKDNKIYSPETCIILPQRINMIFMSKSNSTGLPNGFRQNKDGTYSVKYNTIPLGKFDTFENGMNAYLKAKRIHIREVSNEFKDRIPLYIYEALLNW